MGAITFNGTTVRADLVNPTLDFRTIHIVGYTVNAQDVTRTLTITGGSGFTTGVYSIVDVNTIQNEWDLDRACGQNALAMTGTATDAGGGGAPISTFEEIPFPNTVFGLSRGENPPGQGSIGAVGVGADNNKLIISAARSSMAARIGNSNADWIGKFVLIESDLAGELIADTYVITDTQNSGGADILVLNKKVAFKYTGTNRAQGRITAKNPENVIQQAGFTIRGPAGPAGGPPSVATATRAIELQFLQDFFNTHKGSAKDLVEYLITDHVKCISDTLANLFLSKEDRAVLRSVGIFIDSTRLGKSLDLNTRAAYQYQYNDVQQNILKALFNTGAPCDALNLIHAPCLVPSDFTLTGWDSSAITSILPEIPTRSRFGLVVDVAGTPGADPTITLPIAIADAKNRWYFHPLPILSFTSDGTLKARAYISGSNLVLQVTGTPLAGQTCYFNVLCVG